LSRLFSTLVLLILSSPPSGVHAQGVSPEELFRQAQAASRQKDYARAEKLYRQILALDPDILPARVNLGLACYWQHKSREAVSELQTALRVSPTEFSALLFSGLAYIDLTEYDRAQKMLEQARQVNDNDPLLYWALGSLAMIHNDANTAVPLLERCASLAPDNVRCVWLLGTAYAILAYRDDQKPVVPADYAARADATLRWMEEHQPDSALLHVFKGDVLAARKPARLLRGTTTSQALSEYQRALEIDPSWPDIHLLIGSLLGLENRWDEAQAELKWQLQDHPGDSRAMVEIGSVHCRSGNYADAVPYLTQALTLDSNNYEANYRLGQAYLALSKDKLAIPFLERATHLSPQKSDPYYLLFRAYRTLKQPAKAASALEKFKRLKALGS
jgi:tetratricopeptide (TPR) repeat protein